MIVQLFRSIELLIEKYFLNVCYVQGTILSAGESAVNETDISVLLEFTV